MLAYLPKSHSRFFHVYYALEALTKVGGKVLDVGCGRGGITMTIKRSFPKLSVTACDKDEGALREFRKDAKRLGIKILKSDAHKLPFKDASFEAVVMFDVLEHLKIPQRAILEAARVTKKGGVFHLVVPIEAELSTLDGWIKKIFGKNLKRKPIGHIQQFFQKDIENFLSAAKLKPEKFYYSYHFFFQIISFIYFFFVSAKGGEYIPLVSESRIVNKLISSLATCLGWITYLESKLLSGVKGQALHITSKKM
ncbi:hypothetical protein A2115_01460 [Candidatus Woesebacteria bacterium GWA1_41_8]|uniref:Methyltransferase type 11 domain-containing protein n=1 Tax=Candidatus Woesebacteria bacterium GWA1_41_8 TaxID=1802471 RepID=A0A1F7WHA6_9BACT|nr:MAG: hypothetical protein A2115_01460 [Candidatus Woesebacteria bacterium GWA1_41_8]